MRISTTGLWISASRTPSERTEERIWLGASETFGVSRSHVNISSYASLQYIINDSYDTDDTRSRFPELHQYDDAPTFHRLGQGVGLPSSGPCNRQELAHHNQGVRLQSRRRREEVTLSDPGRLRRGARSGFVHLLEHRARCGQHHR